MKISSAINLSPGKSFERLSKIAILENYLAERIKSEPDYSNLTTYGGFCESCNGKSMKIPVI